MKKRFGTPLARFLFVVLGIGVLYFWKQPAFIQGQIHSTQNNTGFILSFSKFPLKVQWFLAIEGFIIFFWFVNGIFLLINGRKLDAYLRENNFSRWAELHDEYGTANYAYQGYYWGNKDNENEFISNMKIRVRWGFILCFLPLVLTGLGIYLFFYFFHG